MSDILTLTQLQTELALVNSQIEAILQGKRVEHLRVGSSSFTREYKFTKMELTECRIYRRYLIQEIHDKGTEAPTFRTNATIPNIVRKQIQGC